VPKRRSVETGRRCDGLKAVPAPPRRCVVMTGPSLQDPTACQGRSHRLVAFHPASRSTNDEPSVTAQIVSVPPMSWT
jgi:hypothetical protein